MAPLTFYVLRQVNKPRHNLGVFTDKGAMLNKATSYMQHNGYPHLRYDHFLEANQTQDLKGYNHIIYYDKQLQHATLKYNDHCML